VTEPQTLSDLGERRIVEEILRSRYGAGSGTFGDDCAQLTVDAGSLVVTTDPCPHPMAHIVGFTDEYYRGWLLGTINLSDLAAAGARPLGLLTSLVLPSDMAISNLIRLLDGIDDCCAAAGTAVVGGNLKEGKAIDVQATAIGQVDGKPLGRSGAATGDVVYAVGPTGFFWAAVLLFRAGTPAREIPAALLELVLTPRPQLAFGQALQGSGVRAAVMDNSDGLGPSLQTLSVTNSVRIRVDLDDLEFNPAVTTAAAALGVDPVRLALGWGDWNLVVSVAAEDATRLEVLAAGVGAPAIRVASVHVGAGVTVARGADEIPLRSPDSERFAADSWFTAGLDAYIEPLLSFDLP
jgi:thiamine-monophosphate kinase